MTLDDAFSCSSHARAHVELTGTNRHHPSSVTRRDDRNPRSGVSRLAHTRARSFELERTLRTVPMRAHTSEPSGFGIRSSARLASVHAGLIGLRVRRAYGGAL